MNGSDKMHVCDWDWVKRVVEDFADYTGGVDAMLYTTTGELNEWARDGMRASEAGNRLVDRWEDDEEIAPARKED